MSFATIDDVRRECIRIGSLLDRSDSTARDAVSKIQVQADKAEGASMVADLSAALDVLNTQLVATTDKSGTVTALATK